MLKNHFSFKHTKDSFKHEVECEKCGQSFSTSLFQKNHTRDDHGKTDECVFYKSNRCRFGKTCWKIHNGNSDSDPFHRFSCKEGFQTMSGLMSHRKKEHIELCKPCQPRNGNCRFENTPERCWFVHQSFQEARKKHNPPSS